MYENETDHANNIVTVDETWLYYFDLPLKIEKVGIFLNHDS